MKARGLPCALILVSVYATAAYADPEDVRPFTLYVLGRNTYNDNIYNLPANVSVTDVNLGSGAARDDWIQTGAIGLAGNWQLGAQQFVASLQLDYNRFRHNDTLNNASTDDKVQWKWRLGPRLSGKLYATYGQGLAGFANTRFFSKDIVRTSAQYGEVDWEIGPHWIAKASGRRATTTHSADQLVANDFRSNAGTFGIDYLTADENTVGWDYRRLRASFPHSPLDNTLLANRAYTEDSGNFHTDYQLTGKTAFEGRVGYLRRSYSNPAAATREGDFSGTVWRAALLYQMTTKTRFVLTGSRDLTAYIDAQSDYFVSTGANLSVLWNAREALAVTLGVAREHDAYVGQNPNLAFTDTRRDWITSGQGLVTWTPRRYFRAELAYRLSNRSSTTETFGYRYNTISLELRLVL